MTGHQDPTVSFFITKAFHGLRKIKPPKESRKPITPDILLTLVHTLSDLHITAYQKILFKAMFLTAFFALCRISEITQTSANHNLHLNDLNFNEGQCSFSVTFRSFKHSKCPVTNHIYMQDPKDLCPVAALQSYVGVRGGVPGPLFALDSGAPVTRQLFVSVLEAVIKKSNLNKMSLNTHSFRIGGATYAARRGMTQLQIQRLGRWSSNAYMKYLRW